MDEIRWREWLQTSATALVAALVVIGTILFTLNTPTSFDRVQGTVVRLGANDSKYTLGTRAFIELFNGRTVTVYFPAGTNVPEPGTTITLTRGTRRFLGEVYAP